MTTRNDHYSCFEQNVLVLKKNKHIYLKTVIKLTMMIPERFL